MDEQLEFIAKYAKGNRLKCNICHRCIAKNSLKISILTEFHANYRWYHTLCILLTPEKPESISLIANFDNIKWDDQELLKKLVESEPLNDLKIEYVPSNDTCISCNNPINEGHIKINKKKEDTGLFEAWHLQCFANHRNTFNFFSPGCILPGFLDLKKKDQTNVLKILPPVKDEDLPLDAATGMSDLDVLMKNQNKKFFAMREEIQQLTKNEVVELMIYNGQRCFNNPDNLKDNLSDCLAFGSVNPCTKCAGKNTFISGFGYVCTGQQSQQKSGCGNISTDPKRSEFKIPPNFKEKYEFLKNYVPNVEKRLMRITAPSNIRLNLSPCNNSTNSEQIVGHVEPENSELSDKRDIIDLKTDLEGIDRIYQRNDIKYSVKLDAIDYPSGQISLYKLQIWQYSNEQKYSLLQIWSENNTKSWKLESMPLDMCIHRFECLFFEKTGNLWNNRDQFVKHPFKMNLINN